MIFPTPFLARNNLLRSPPKSILVMQTAGAFDLVGSTDHRVFKQMRPAGEIAGKSFLARAHLVHGGFIYIGGVDQSVSPYKAKLYRASLAAPNDFAEVASGFDVIAQSSEVIGIVANATYIVALEARGSIAVSTNNGASFARFDTLSPAGTFANTIVAAESGFAVSIGSNSLRTAIDPRGAWTVRNPGFGDLAPGPATVTILMASAANYAAITHQNYISTAAIANPSAFTRRATPPDVATTYTHVGLSDGEGLMMAFGAPRGGGTGAPVYMRSVDGGLNWEAPGEAHRPALRLFMAPSYIDETFFGMMGNDGTRIARTLDGLAWDDIRTNAANFAGTGKYFIPLAA